MQEEELFNQENPEKKTKKSPLLSLEKDLKFFNESMKEIALEIMLEGVSAHPIFIAHQHEVQIGELILDKEELGTEWTINVATVEDFVAKGIIKPERKEAFLKSYKKAQDYMCVFVVVPEGANFVYYPYQKEDI